MKRSPTFILLLLGILAASYTPVSQYRIKNNALVIPYSIVFKNSTSAKLSAESNNALNYVKQYLTDKSYISTLRVEGHVAPGSGSEDQLSKKRAKNVCKWLMQNGIDCSRLVAVGFGSSKPIADTSTAEGKSMNTRIEFVNVAIKSRTIRNMSSDGGGKSAGDPCSF